MTVTLVPSQQSAAGLLAEFPRGDGSVLLVQAVDAEPTMADGLTAIGWQVTTIAPYRTIPARPSAGLQLAALSADAAVFTAAMLVGMFAANRLAAAASARRTFSRDSSDAAQ